MKKIMIACLICLAVLVNSIAFSADEFSYPDDSVMLLENTNNVKIKIGQKIAVYHRPYTSKIKYSITDKSLFKFLNEFLEEGNLANHYYIYKAIKKGKTQISFMLFDKKNNRQIYKTVYTVEVID